LSLIACKESAPTEICALSLHDALPISDPDAEEAETHLKARALLETASGGVGAAAPVPTPIEVAGGPAGAGRRVLLVDHEDSFVNTLGDYFRQHGCEVTTLRFGFDAAEVRE